MADVYRFIGSREIGYFRYVDLSTSSMLIAQPGGEYQMRSVDWGAAIPPDADNWVLVEPPPAPPAPEVKKTEMASSSKKEAAPKPESEE